MKKSKNKILMNVQENLDWLDAIINNSFSGIYITDGNANTINLNKAYEAITGLKRSEVIGRNMKDLVRDGLISDSGSMRAINEHKMVVLQQEFKTGKKALITSTPVYDSDGEIIMVVTNVNDITEVYSLKKAVAMKNEQEMMLREELELIRGKLFNNGNLIAVDEATLSVVLMADKVAPMDSTVMLIGETGVGKEVFAEYIYKNSQRRGESFIRVNCGAIPANLIESELFGYEKGAFTGANKNGKRGLFEIANNGTLFLDEIGELPLDLQVKLLRVLQEQEITRVGGVEPIKIDTRIIAATNRNLKNMVELKEFREDLFYRLMVFPIYVPPLKDRKKDIVPLAEMYLEHLNRKYGVKKYFSEKALALLCAYNWPGNVREVKNIVERAFIINNENELTADNLCIMPTVCNKPKYQMLMPGEKINLKSIVDDLEFDYIERAYEIYGNVRDAADSLDMSHTTFVRKRQKYISKLEETEAKV